MGVTSADIWKRAQLPKCEIQGAPVLEGVYVRGMSIEEAADWDEWAPKHGGREIARRILLDFCVNADGEQIFTEEDVPNMRLLSSEALAPMMAAFAEVNAATREEAEALAKNLNGRRKTSSSRSRRT